MQARLDIQRLPTAYRGLILTVSAMLTACATTPAMKTPAKEVSRVAVQQDANGFAITEAVRASPEARGEYQRATQLLAQERYAEGIPLLLNVTQSAPDATAAHIDLGIAYSRSGDLEQAEKSLKRALELNPQHPIAHNEIGMLYRKTGQFQAARAAYEKALALYPEFHFARRNLAILCDIYLGDFQCALTNYEAYRQSVPGDEQAAMWIADLRNRIK